MNRVKVIELQGARVPALGLGTWQLSGRQCREAVGRGLELGYRHIDTAQAYGNEQEVGAAIRDSGLPRDDIWVTTKIWYEHLDRDGVRRSTDASLERLGLEAVDLLLIHWPNPRFPIAESLEAMQALCEEGQVRYVGVSNFPPSLTEEAAKVVPILCNQVEYHPLLVPDRLLEVAAGLGIMITAYCPLARGKVARNDVLSRIGARHGKSGAQVALRWLLEQDNVSAVPKAAQPGHLRENLDIFDFELDEDDKKRIARLDRGLRLMDPDWAPDWKA